MSTLSPDARSTEEQATRDVIDMERILDRVLPQAANNTGKPVQWSQISPRDAATLIRYIGALRELASASLPSREDRERLDWLQSHPTDFDRGVPIWQLGARESGRVVLEGPSLRAAIDAAMQASTEEERHDG